MRIHSPGLFRALSFLLLAASSANACAQSGAAPEPMTVPQLIALARQENLDLKSARYALDIARARLDQAGLRPNPVLDLGARSDFVFGNEGERGGSIAISQAFPVSGRLLREKDVARVDIALAESEIAEHERQLAGEVATDAYRVLLLDQRIESTWALIKLQTQLASTTRERFKAAEVSQLDVSTARLDLLTLQQARAQLQGQRESLLLAINTRIGRPATAPLMIAGEIPSTNALPGLAELQARALAQRPDLQSAQQEVERAGAQKALARSLRREDWRLGLEFSQDRQVIAGAPPQGNSRLLGVSVSIPLPLRDQSRGRFAEAAATQDQAAAHVEALRLAIASEVASAHREATRLQSALTDYERDMVPASAANVRLAQQGYGQGLVPLVEVVQTQRQGAALNEARLDLLEQFLQALVRIHTATGDYLAGADARR